MLDATTTTGTSGKISLLAVDDRAKGGFFGAGSAAGGFLGFANLDYITTSITIGRATIRGGNVQIIATSDTLLSWAMLRAPLVSRSGVRGSGAVPNNGL